MAQESARNVALLAIKPVFAERIMANQKKVEFRKSRFADSVRSVVVYASSPVKQVVGWFDISYVDEDDPESLWRRHSHHGGISQEAFEEYFEAKEVGFAIGVQRVNRLRNPIPLSKLSDDLCAPQSFLYLSDSMFKALKRK